jgi:hypothetical protein
MAPSLSILLYHFTLIIMQIHASGFSIAKSLIKIYLYQIFRELTLDKTIAIFHKAMY